MYFGRRQVCLEKPKMCATFYSAKSISDLINRYSRRLLVLSFQHYWSGTPALTLGRNLQNLTTNKRFIIQATDGGTIIYWIQSIFRWLGRSLKKQCKTVHDQLAGMNGFVICDTSYIVSFVNEKTSFDDVDYLLLNSLLFNHVLASLLVFYRQMVSALHRQNKWGTEWTFHSFRHPCQNEKQFLHSNICTSNMRNANTVTTGWRKSKTVHAAKSYC